MKIVNIPSQDFGTVPIIERRVDPSVKYHTGCDDVDSALAKQVSGSHYKDLAIQPVEYINANKIGYFEGNVIKYVSRWKTKNGIPDLEKAKHYLEMLIEFESKANV